jgi:hypothetical protein
MSLWHADMDGPSLARGAQVVVFNDHRVVRVVASDQILIETPTGARLNTMVVERSGTTLSLSVPDHLPARLSLVEDGTLSRRTGKAFSRQLWEVQ